MPTRAAIMSVDAPSKPVVGELRQRGLEDLLAPLLGALLSVAGVTMA